MAKTTEYAAPSQKFARLLNEIALAMETRKIVSVSMPVLNSTFAM
jgi:hypothetical protein